MNSLPVARPRREMWAMLPPARRLWQWSSLGVLFDSSIALYRPDDPVAFAVRPVGTTGFTD